jgi:homoserine kinase type II
MPGRPLDQPIRNQIELGCQALARLHRTWKPVGETRASCPAIQRRLAIFDHWDQRPQSLRATPGWVLASTEWLRTQLPRVRAELIRWLAVPVPVHPCLCDAHSAHILFSDHRVSGIIDYGAMKLDSPAVDLARWLGDLVPSSSEEFRHGIAAYRAILDPAESPPDKLVMVLARSGSLAALANWQLRWGNPGQHWCASFEHRVNAILERCVAEFR